MAKNVLLVDDSNTMRKIISRSLRQAGLEIGEICEGGDGIEGLAALGKNKVDVILSDINMPNMDGLEFVKTLRAEGYTQPVIMITTEGGEQIIEEAMLFGANGSIKKPFTPEQLLEKLGQYF